MVMSGTKLNIKQQLRSIEHLVVVLNMFLCGRWKQFCLWNDTINILMKFETVMFQ